MFQYIQKLRTEGPQEWVFQECKVCRIFLALPVDKDCIRPVVPNHRAAWVIWYRAVQKYSLIVFSVNPEVCHFLMALWHMLFWVLSLSLVVNRCEIE